MELPDRTDPEEPALKADPTSQIRLLDLQAVDSTLDQIAHRLRQLPEAQALDELLNQQSRLESERDTLGAEVADLAREQRKADADVEQVKTRRTRNRERIDAGQIGDPRQLQAMQHETETLERRISDLEDVELDVLERLEAAQNRLQAVEADLGSLAPQVAEAASAKDAATTDIAGQREAAQTQRETVAAEIPPPLLALYGRLRDQLGGVGVGAIVRKRCTGCQLDIGAADLAQMASAPEDEVLRCENCDRILVRAPDTGL